jgi:ABC-2 type transport system permease protein
VGTQDAFNAAIDSRDAMFGLSIAQDFSRQLTGHPAATVQLIFDGRASNTAQILQGYASGIIARFNDDWRDTHGWRPLPEPPAVRGLYNSNLESLWVVVPGLVGVLSMLMSLVVTALSVAREREVGTFEQLLVTPLRPFEILVGKTIPGVLVGLFATTIAVFCALVWFRLPMQGSALLLYGSAVVVLLSVVGVGLFISALVETQQQAILGVFLFMVPSVILSGFATPLENMPDWIQAITYLNPLRYYLVITQGIFLKALPWTLVLHELWPMAAIGTVTLAAAGWFFRHRMN